MSFASQVKEEVCRLPLQNSCCALAELYGIFLFCNTYAPGQIKVVTENSALAERLPKLLKRAFGFGFDQMGKSQSSGKYTLLLDNPEKVAHVFGGFGDDVAGHVACHINFGLMEDDCCRTSFIRGAFLAGGSVTDPEKRYHLELVTTHQTVGAEMDALLLDQGFRPKLTTRSGNCILYFKQSNYIEDFLTTIGAPVCAMKIMEAKVEKDLRNEVNRRVNCETANLFKAVDAAQDQLAAIRRLDVDTLPAKLQATVRMRMEHPEATLQELADMMEPPVSKSAMNHRMRKLLALAKEIQA